MTIIVGIISKDAIVFASDSQTSYSPTSRARRDVDKIHQLAFRSGQKVMIAESGDADFTSRAIETYSELLLENDFDHRRKAVDLLEDAIKQVKIKASALNGWTLGDDASIAYWKDLDAVLLLAYYLENEPLIYMFRSWPGDGVWQKGKTYVTVGCGSTVGESILQRLKTTAIDSTLAVVNAIYTVEEVKTVDSFCGGPTKLGFLFKDGVAAVSNQVAANSRLMKVTLETIAKYDEQVRKNWNDLMNGVVMEVTQKLKDDETGTS